MRSTPLLTAIAAYGPGLPAWRRMRWRLATNLSVCWAPRRLRFVRQNTRTLPRQPHRSQALDDALAEAAVDEELRPVLNMTRHRRRLSDAASLSHGSGRRPGREPDHGLDLVAWDREVGGEVRDRVAGLEAVDQVLDTCAAVDE